MNNNEYKHTNCNFIIDECPICNGKLIEENEIIKCEDCNTIR